ncbi:SAF domain-containing protein [Brachybacterium sp. DNPG3]
MLDRLRSSLPRWRRALRRRRRILLLLVAVSILAAGTPSLAAALMPPEHRGADVVVAARDIAPGAEIGSADLTVVRVADALVPAGAADSPDTLRGRRSSVAVPAGTVLLPGMLTADGEAVPEGMALLALSAPAALSSRLEPGARLHVHAASSATGAESWWTSDADGSGGSAGSPGSGRADGADTIIEVLVVEGPGTASGSSIDLGSPGGSDVEVLVAVDLAEEAELARVVSEGWFTVSVIG